jgi:glycosyltransferase involved in cell wall biosynthesis
LSTRSPKVLILLATYNGADFLQQQLDSIRAQTHEQWELLASDDGSTDETRELLARFAASVPQSVVVLEGPKKGFWRNFVSLVRSEAADADLYAFCDQDDIWFHDKLARAVAWFETQADVAPALYFSRTELIGSDGATRGYSPEFVRPPTFQNALVQNIGGGNTMVFNRRARLFLRATPQGARIVSHDWWAYQLVTGVGGTAHYDPKPSLQYRQHGQNLVGGNRGFKSRLLRIQAFAGGQVAAWSEVNLSFLHAMRELLLPESVIVLDRFARARNGSAPMRLWQLWKSGVYRQTTLENIGLYLGALFRKL